MERCQKVTALSKITPQSHPSETVMTAQKEQEDSDIEEGNTMLLVGDDQLVNASHDDVTLIAKSGALLDNTEDLLYASIEQTQYKYVKSVVIALVTNDMLMMIVLVCPLILQSSSNCYRFLHLLEQHHPKEIHIRGTYSG